MATSADHFRNFGAAAQDFYRGARRDAGTAAGAAREEFNRAGGARGVYGKAREWLGETARGYRSVHSNDGSLKDYASSDEGRATARRGAGEALNNFLLANKKKHAKRGSLLGGLFFNTAHLAFQRVMTNLKNDQRTFVNVARVRRGDPDVKHLTHNELR
ncbi:MAG: hypothetical protein E6Q97_04445, partial [Desulfurellales bacterium]